MLLVVLGVVCLCYRQVVKAYPVSGGSYVVSRENFGYSIAQIPAAALVCSYILTVAVSVAAGVDAVISAFPVFTPYPVELSVLFVLLLTFGNLRGIREAGRIFAVPTYWFLASMAGLLVTGIVRVAISGHLHRYPLHASGHVPVGTAGGGLLLGASAFIFLRAFANGGSAMTGMEAISNSVTIFREPQVRNARATLVLMASILGVMFVGVSVLAALTHAVPFSLGTPTVLSEIGRAVFGQGTDRQHPLLLPPVQHGVDPDPRGEHELQRLSPSRELHRLGRLPASPTHDTGTSARLLERDPRAQLRLVAPARGHRGAGREPDPPLRLHRVHRVHDGRRRHDQVPPQPPRSASGEEPRHQRDGVRRQRDRHGHLRRHRVHPRGVARRHRDPLDRLRPDAHASQLRGGKARARRGPGFAPGGRADTAASCRHRARGPLGHGHGRALQLAASLTSSGDVRAVHFSVETERADRISSYWRKPGLANIPLEIVECPDRRIVRGATELAAEHAADGETEVTLVLPRRVHRGVASRLLHDRTSDRIVSAVNQLPHVSATIAPFDVAGHAEAAVARPRRRSLRHAATIREIEGAQEAQSPNRGG